MYPERLADGEGIREWIGPLQPDLVAEHLVVDVLSERQDLTCDLFRGLDEYRASRALTVLARAARTENRSLELIRIALAEDLEHLVIPAMSVAVETNPALGRLLAKTLSDHPISASTLERITGIALDPSAALAPAAVVVARQLADESPTDVARAGWLVNLSNRLGDLKEPEQALAAIEQATAIYRRLADDRPDEFLFNLGVTLSNESGRLGELHRWAEALDVVEQALAIYDQLAEKHPDEYLPAVAMSLNSLSNCLARLDRPQDALEAARQAAFIYRQLAEDNPGFVPHFATAMNNSSNRLASLGRWDPALAAIGWAVNILRQLAEDRPDVYLDELSRSLLNQANCLVHLDRHPEALAPVEDAVSIRRNLVKLYGDAFPPGLSNALNDLANLLDSLDRYADAKAAREEAAAVLSVPADPSDPAR